MKTLYPLPVHLLPKKSMSMFKISKHGSKNTYIVLIRAATLKVTYKTILAL